MKDVLRLKPGEEVEMFDENGNEYDCVVEKVTDKQIELRITMRRLAPVKLDTVRITVACAIPKKVKMDDIVDKLTQLGVDRIIPLETERTIVRMEKLKKFLRLERWKRIAKSSSQQCKRSDVPVIESVRSMEEFLAEAGNFELKLIPTLSGENRSIKEVFSGSNARNILVLIGPEGDFSENEVRAAMKAGCIPVSLGKLVLRVDTAAIAVVSYIKFHENS
jgi:16S rRNA (uracil1498-N3)-methyltransferase